MSSVNKKKSPRAKKPTPLVAYADPEGDVPDLAVAAGVLQAVLKRAKLDSLAELVNVARDAEVFPGSVALSRSQLAAVAGFSGPLSRVSRTVTLAVCAECEDFLLVSSGMSVPKKCNLTGGCLGVLVKAKAPKRVSV